MVILKKYLTSALLTLTVTSAAWSQPLCPTMLRVQSSSENISILGSAISGHSTGLASRVPSKRPYRMLQPPQFSGGEIVSGYLKNRKYDFDNPDFKMMPEEVEHLTTEANSIMGLGKNAYGFRKPFLPELERLGIHVEKEFLFEEQVYQEYQRGLKWESFKVSTEGDHWLNKAARDIQKKGWPIDLYFDPALMLLRKSDGMTIPTTRSGRIGIVLYSDLIYHRSENYSNQNKSTIVDSHEWVHVLAELTRRGLLNYHPNSPVNIYVYSRNSLGLGLSYDRSFSFEEMVTYAHQYSLVESYEREKVFARTTLRKISEAALKLTDSMQDLWKETELVTEKSGQRWLKVGSPSTREFSIFIPNSVTNENAISYAQNQIKNAIALAQFNIENIPRLNVEEFRKAQLKFIDELK